MARALEKVRVGSNGPWRVQAVGMPPEAAQGAWEDGTVLSRGLLAGVADNGLLPLVHNLMVVEIDRLDGLLLPVSVCQLTCGTVLRALHIADDRPSSRNRWAGRKRCCKTKRTYLTPLGCATKSSYSPSAPVLTPSKYSRTFLGNRKLTACFLSRAVNKGPKGPLYSLTMSGFRLTMQSWQSHVASSSWMKLDSIRGSWQSWWKARWHPSQQTISPLPPQAEQKSSLSSCTHMLAAVECSSRRSGPGVRHRETRRRGVCVR